MNGRPHFQFSLCVADNDPTWPLYSGHPLTITFPPIHLFTATIRFCSEDNGDVRNHFPQKITLCIADTQDGASYSPAPITNALYRADAVEARREPANNHLHITDTPTPTQQLHQFTLKGNGGK